MTYKIVADSSANLTSHNKGVPFESVPLRIMTDEKEYVDTAALDVHGMLDDLAKYKGRSHTSCPNSEEYLASFGDAENVFVVTITAELSGSYNAAKVAASAYMEEYPERRVHVVNSRSTGGECVLLCDKLAELINAGLSFDEIVEQITAYNKRTRLIFALESMRNLANNGRVSHLVAKMASIMGIRAIGRASSIGTLEMTMKSRGVQNAASDIVKSIVAEGCLGGKIYLNHAENEIAARLIKEKLEATFENVEVIVGELRGLCGFYAERGGIMLGFEAQTDD